MATETGKKSEQILAFIQERSSAKIGDLREATGLSAQTVLYHLHILQTKKLVKNDKKSRTWFVRAEKGVAQTALFAAESPEREGPNPDDPRTGTIQPGSLTARALELLEKSPEPITRGYMLNALGIKKSQSLSTALKRLRLLGKAMTIGRGLWRLTNQGHPAEPQPAAKRKYTKRAELLPAIPAQRATRNAPAFSNSTAMIRVGPASFSARQVESMILRMENANEYAAFFTPLDFDVLHKLLEVAR